MNEMVVYQIVNKINSKVYIGSSIHFSVRVLEHTRDLKSNRHHSLYLQRSWNKYGENNFSFEILEKVSIVDELLNREQYWIDYYDSSNPDNGYNMCPLAGRTTGYKHSEESKQKISKAIKERGNGLTGKIKSDESKDKVSQTLKEMYSTNIEFAQKQKEARKKQRGEGNARAKLTEKDVIEIKSLLDSGNYTQKEIGEMFNVTQLNISRIKCGKTWKHVS